MKFSKYHGYGNDFIIGTYQEGIDYEKLAIRICDRHTGIGADGLIILKLDNLEMMFYNADGYRGTMCGNGIRCLVKYICDEKLADVSSGKIEIQTLSGKRMVYIDGDNFTVNMGKPIFDTKSIGVSEFKDPLNMNIKYKNTNIKVSGCFMTTDHIVVLKDELDHDTELGKFLCTNKVFSRGINVNFVKVINRKEIAIDTYERGVGWTLACGSGSCASFAILNKMGLVEDDVTVDLHLGKLKIYKNEDNDVIMKGTATLVSNNIEYNV